MKARALIIYMTSSYDKAFSFIPKILPCDLDLGLGCLLQHLHLMRQKGGIRRVEHHFSIVWLGLGGSVGGCQFKLAVVVGA